MNLCKTSHLKSWILGACLVASWGPIAAAGTYRIARQGETWQLLSDGEPFHIKGAVGWAHFDVLHDYGGNAIRAGANKRDLDDAHAHQLRVMAGLPVRARAKWLELGRRSTRGRAEAGGA